MTRAVRTGPLLVAAIVLVMVAILIAAYRRRAEVDAAVSTTGLREMALTAPPSGLGIPVVPGRPWGVMMDSTRPNGTVSIVAFADGNASLYLSTGGGVLGGGAHAKVREAALQVVDQASTALPKLRPAGSHPFPAEGQTCFYVRVDSNLLFACAASEELQGGKHELSPLFTAGQEVGTQLRAITRRRR